MGWNYCLGCIPCREYITVGQDGAPLWSEDRETMALVQVFLQRHERHTLLYSTEHDMEEWKWIPSAFDFVDPPAPGRS
jgi:hypothetical protein